MTLTVAVVEDDESVLDAIRVALGERGWHIETYTTGEALLDDLERLQPDCVLIDPHLPKMNGAELARTLASSFDIPFIGLSARPTSPIALAVADCGAHTMLTKPASAEQIASGILAAIDSKSRQAQ